MAQEDVIALIKRSIIDDTFRLALSRDFDKAVEANLISLTDEEKQSLSNLSWEGPLPGAPTEGSWVHIYSQ